jgi:hypothetical protein
MNNETSIAVKDLQPGQQFRRTDADTVYTCVGFPRSEGGRTVVRYTAEGLDQPWEYNTFSLATVYVVE